MSDSDDDLFALWAERVLEVQPEPPPSELRPRRVELELVDDHLEYDRPRTRGDCAGGERPCPWVSCRHHLYLDVSPDTGKLKLNRPDLEVWEIEESCALDVADRGGAHLGVVAQIFGHTRQRASQIEIKALKKVRRADRLGDGALAEVAEDEGLGRSAPRSPAPKSETSEDDEDEDDEERAPNP